MCDMDPSCSVWSGTRSLPSIVPLSGNRDGDIGGRKWDSVQMKGRNLYLRHTDTSNMELAVTTETTRSGDGNNGKIFR